MAGLLAVFVAQPLVAPITRLTAVAHQIAAGDLSVQAPVDSADEIGALATTFNSMTARLRQTLLGLEDRRQRLGIIAGLSERLSALLSLDTLLPEVVNQIKDKFGYYHAHIYLLDDKGEKLVVTAGTGLAGVEMKTKGHNISLDAPPVWSLAPRAVVKLSGWTTCRLKTGLPNPLLPDTYSEMAVPITLEGQVVGVLDVQQDKIAGLDENDAYLLRTLANQMAIAIRNARQFTEVQAALTDAREAQQQYIAQGWDKSRVTKKNVGRVRYSLGEFGSLEENLIAAARQQALKQSGPTTVALNSNQPDADSSDETRALVAPITLRNVPIGNLQLHADPVREWSEADLALINAIVDQVAQAAENLRLVSETQERAGREQLLNQVSEKLRRAPDMETLLQTGVSELARILGPARTFAHLNMNVGQPLQKGNGVEVGQVDNLS
ncbi:MAG: GAF domain-containing protein [Anaerolineae bacterium]